MTTPNLDERLLQTLASQAAPQSAKALATALGISQPTLSRALRRLGNQQLAVLGQARSTRYALFRDIRGMGHHFPVIRIGADGSSVRAGELLALSGDQFYVRWDSGSGSGQAYEDLPWFAWDMRPQGFLGRALIQQHPELSLPNRWQDWSSEDILQWLVLHGSACPGNLIIGEPAFQDWQDHEARHQQSAIPHEDRPIAYVLHHDPYMGIDGPESQQELSAMFEETKSRYEERFGAYPLAQLSAVRCKGHACHSPSPCACRTAGACTSHQEAA